MPRRRARLRRRIWLALGLAGVVLAIGTWYAVPRVARVFEIKSLAAAAHDGAQVPTVEQVSYRSDGKRIAADLYVPPNPKGYMVFAHGNRPEGRKHPLALALAAGLGAHFTTLAFDFRGYGESDPLGPYRPGMTLDLTADIMEGARYLAARFGVPVEEVILVGHSFGSVTVGLAGKKLGSRQVVAIGSGDVEDMIRNAEQAEAQTRKLKKIDLDVPSEDVPALYAPLHADKVFDECPVGDRIFIWGEKESSKNTLTEHLDRLRRNCATRVIIAIIPLANHMYWSEGREFRSSKLYSVFIHDRDWADSVVGAILIHLLG